jgi:hypothetical protein|tara:strand:+ start:148 stop:738 length:591 start_codon:yes stop_codon:yes gene_type:complete
MPRVQITDNRGLEQKTGTGVALDSTIDSTLTINKHTIVEASTAHSAAGTLSVKIDKGIHHYPIIQTGPAHAASLATGAHTLTAANLATGFCTVAGNATNVAVTMLTRAQSILLFGGSSNITVGDSIVWSLHNPGATVNHTLVLTTNTGAVVPASAAGKVGSNAANNNTATAPGSSTGRFQTRVTNVDGSTKTIRLA